MSGARTSLALVVALVLTAPTSVEAAIEGVLAAAPATVPACLPAEAVDCVAMPAVESTAGGERARITVARYAALPAEVERRYHAWAADNACRLSRQSHGERTDVHLYPTDGAAPTTVRIFPDGEGAVQVTVTAPLPALPRLPSWVPRCAGCRLTHLFVEGGQLLAILVGAGSAIYGAGLTDAAFHAAGWTRPPAVRDPRADHTRRYTQRSSSCTAVVEGIEGDAQRSQFRVAITCQRPNR